MQNQISEFEFISILISIIIGLDVTNLFPGQVAPFSGVRRIRLMRSTSF
jgi:hypothetical protein